MLSAELTCFLLCLSAIVCVPVVLTIVATATAMNYFQQTFSYGNSGLSLFCGWISVVFTLILFGCTVFRCIIAYKSDKEQKQKMQNEGKIQAQTYEKRLFTSLHNTICMT